MNAASTSENKKTNKVKKSEITDRSIVVWIRLYYGQHKFYLRIGNVTQSPDHRTIRQVNKLKIISCSLIGRIERQPVSTNLKICISEERRANFGRGFSFESGTSRTSKAGSSRLEIIEQKIELLNEKLDRLLLKWFK